MPWPAETLVRPIYAVDVTGTRAGNIQITVEVEALYLELFECSPQQLERMLHEAARDWVPAGVCHHVEVRVGRGVLARLQMQRGDDR